MQQMCIRDRKTSDGKILKCSTSYIRDDDGTLHYVFGINYDITKLTMIESALHALVTPVNKEEKPKEITHSVNDLLDHLIEESVALVGKPVALMNKEDKVTAIQFLNDSGAFLITKSCLLYTSQVYLQSAQRQKALPEFWISCSVPPVFLLLFTSFPATSFF